MNPGGGRCPRLPGDRPDRSTTAPPHHRTTTACCLPDLSAQLTGVEHDTSLSTPGFPASRPGGSDTVSGVAQMSAFSLAASPTDSTIPADGSENANVPTAAQLPGDVQDSELTEANPERRDARHLPGLTPDSVGLIGDPCLKGKVATST
jgi:hypothetical protein